MSASTVGSYLQWFLVAGGKFTVLSYVASLIWFYFTPPERENTRILLLLSAAYSFGASFGFYTNYLFKMEQGYVIRLLAGATVGIGNFFYIANATRERSEIYYGYLPYCFFLIVSGIASILLDGHTDLWTITVIHTVQILFMGYIVIYSQEILYLGDIDFINCTFIHRLLPFTRHSDPCCKTIPSGSRS